MVGALAVGLAMMVAVEVINSAALARFDAGVRRIAGGVDLLRRLRPETLRIALPAFVDVLVASHDGPSRNFFVERF
jgi:hypothetical protein